MNSITVNLENIFNAFKKWEEGYRVNPEAYLSHEECQNLPADDVSSSRAIYFMELLKE